MSRQELVGSRQKNTKMQQNGYRDLIVWQKAMKLVVAVYELLKDFPREESFGLTAQIKRAVISVPSNIAEGYHHRTAKDRKHFLTISYGSSAELETQIEAAKRLGFGKPENYIPIDSLLVEILKMLNKMSG